MKSYGICLLLTYFTQQNIFDVYLCCHKLHAFTLFNSWVIHHCVYVYVLHIFLVNSPINGNLSCIHIVAIVHNISINLRVQLFLLVCDVSGKTDWCLLFSHSVVSNSLRLLVSQGQKDVLDHLPDLAQTHVHWVSDAIQPSCPLLSPSPPAFNLSQHQSLFQRVGSLNQPTKVLELQLQSSQWIFRTDFLYDGLVGSPCCPRDSQESFPVPQFKSINSLMGFPLYITSYFSLAAFKLLPLSPIFDVLIVICLDMHLFGFILFGILCILWAWVFAHLG